jgi:segregation and condensation protein B
MENTQLSDLKNRLESILFSSGKPMHIEELSRITKENDLERIKNALLELKKDLEDKKSSIMLIQDGDEWKLSVREHYMPFVRKVVSKTELPKTILETLAIVAYKAPVLQSKVIKIRTNKGYRHLDFLEEKGYITREKKGRTKLIKLSQKFYEYFDVPADKLKEKFADFKELETVIEKKEEDLEKKQGKAEKYDREKIMPPVEIYEEKVGDLKVYDSAKKEEPAEEKPEEEEKAEEIEEAEAKEEEVEEEKEEEKPEETEVEEAKEKVEEEPEETEAKEEEVEEEKEEEKPEEAEIEEAKEEKETQEKKPEKAEEKEKAEEEEAKEEIEEKKPKKKKITPETVREEAKKTKPRKRKYKSKGLFPKGIPPKIQEKIDKKVKEMVEGEKEEKERE